MDQQHFSAASRCPDFRQKWMDAVGLDGNTQVNKYVKKTRAESAKKKDRKKKREGKRERKIESEKGERRLVETLLSCAVAPQ